MKHYSITLDENISPNKIKYINNSLRNFPLKYKKPKLQTENEIKLSIQLMIIKDFIYKSINNFGIQNLTFNNKTILDILITSFDIIKINKTYIIKPNNKIADRILNLLEFGRMVGLRKETQKVILPALYFYTKFIKTFLYL